ncbi:hypothetical protein, conserved [Eimeria necatrix]|uniref:Uncharacterized protein n=1 Tax=Eimeria necatrix TaxID=51315 RepID=U6N164_9EIME|nr:hypothetical protein, conserved [Eimeria necatrix]CDJ67675.1 hypothetical protein, conserved [Eimeria necatrix]
MPAEGGPPEEGAPGGLFGEREGPPGAPPSPPRELEAQEGTAGGAPARVLVGAPEDMEVGPPGAPGNGAPSSQQQQETSATGEAEGPEEGLGSL